MIAKEIGKRIKDIRELRGFSQSDLAKMMGVTQGYISSIENGDYSIGVKVLQRVADVLKFDIELIPRRFNTTTYTARRM